MSPNYKLKKVQKKQRRCEAIISADCNIQSSEIPTRYLAILNAGLSCGLTEEQVLNTAIPHGEVTQLLMLPNKSYCFLECCTINDAEGIYEALHGKVAIGQKDAIIYMGFFTDLPQQAVSAWQYSKLPDGLCVLENFITPEEEDDVLHAVGVFDATNEGSNDDRTCCGELKHGGELKHRRVKHFGYEFLYGINNVDVSKPLIERPIPAICNTYWTRLNNELKKRNQPILQWSEPDQLTVNEYESGQGIPPHVDTHSAFLEPILSLSLQSDIVMEFRRRGNEHIPVLLPRRSLLVMSGEARYDWTHGITPRTVDVVPSSSSTLTTRARSKRTSLTFRRLRRGPCNCQFSTHCDTQQSAMMAKNENRQEIDENAAKRLEALNVHNVYEQIANHFSETRHSPWPQVVEFLNSFESGAILADIGCGNGKYLHCNPELIALGCDRSRGLLRVGASKGGAVFECDCLSVPLRDYSLDGCISIAVIHHLATEERRLAALCEMGRLLRVGGRALVYVWARDQRGDEKKKKSSYLLQNKAVNKHKTTEEEQRQQTMKVDSFRQKNNDDGHNIPSLPVHTNRTEFQQQDVLVPWKLKQTSVAKTTTISKTESEQMFLRYYHVFEAGELETLVHRLKPEIELERSYYDQGNHCVIFKRNAINNK